MDRNTPRERGFPELALPPGWTWTTLGEVCEVILGQSPPSSTYNEQGNGLPFYQGSGEFGEMHPVVEKWCTKPKKIAEKADVLLSVRAPVGPTNICEEKSVIGRGLAAIRYPFSDDHRFLFYFFRSIESALSQTGTGSTFSAITKSEIHNLKFLLPPLPEQRRIVAKIEELFSKLDAGVEALKKVKAELKRYRRSVLKHAFEGKLTAEWRKSQIRNPKSEITRMAAEPTARYGPPGQSEIRTPTSEIAFEPTSVLLARIREERMRSIQNSKGKSKKGKEVEPIDTSNLPELPEGWAWARLGEILDDLRYGTAKKCSYESNGNAVLRIPNVINGVIDHSDLKYARFSKEEIEHYRLNEGDILTIRSNGSLSLVGRTALVSAKEKNYLFAGYLIRLRLIPNSVRPKYVNQLFNSQLMRSMIERKAKSTSGVNNINTDELNSLHLPICPIHEQNEIVFEIERRFSIADEVEKTADQSLHAAERLRQSILKLAFEGKLVEQDASDPPASELLEQIRKERQSREELKTTNKNLGRVKRIER